MSLTSSCNITPPRSLYYKIILNFPLRSQAQLGPSPWWLSPNSKESCNKYNNVYYLTFLSKNTNHLNFFSESDFRKKIRGKSLAVVEASLLFVVFQFNGSCFLQRTNDDDENCPPRLMMERGQIHQKLVHLPKTKASSTSSSIILDSIFLVFVW